MENKINCICGAQIQQKRQTWHENSSRHQNFLKTGCQQNYCLYDFENQKMFQIKYYADGKQKNKKFRYQSHNKNDVKANAEAWFAEHMI